MENELLKSIVQSPKILLEIYGDLAKPGVQQVGKALGTVLGLGNTILWPIQLANEKSRLILESNLEKYRVKLENESEREICPVAPEIGVPIAEKLCYVTNEAIGEMYLELLARASVIQHANVAHPGFIKVIENISPDEAVLLQTTQDQLDGIPFVEVRFQNRGQQKWLTLHPMILQSKYYSELQYPDNLPAYISNLEGLGVFGVQKDVYLDVEKTYVELEEIGRNSYSSFTEVDGTRELSCQRGIIMITAFGRLFLRACFSSRTSEPTNRG